MSIALRVQANIGKDRELMHAISKGQKTFVKEIIEGEGQSGINPNDYASEEKYITPMMLAIKEEQLDIIKYFIENFIEKYREDPKEEIIKKPKEKEANNAVERVHQETEKEVFVHRMLEYYRARANPIYICFKRLYYGSTGQNNLLSEVLLLHKELREQASIDFEFKEDYKQLSDQLEVFAENLMNCCESQEEKTTLTDVYQDIEQAIRDGKDLKHVLIKIKQNRRDDVRRQLTLLNWAMEENCEKVIAHPFNQLRLNSVVHDNRENTHKFWTNLAFALVHFLLLTLLGIFLPFFMAVTNLPILELRECVEVVRGYLKSPLRKLLSYMWSILVFNSLLITSSFQDNHEPVKPSVVEWLILSWLFGIFLQAINELYYQGCRRYFSQWWNVVMILMLCCFVVSYILRLVAFTLWADTDSSTDSTLSARYNFVLIANSFFVVGIVLNFMHLSVFLQLTHVVGPLQLALYHLLLDTAKFFSFFTFFFFAFWISFRKLYWLYTGMQKHIAKTQERFMNATEVETDHTYVSEKGMYWLFLSLFTYTDPQSFTTRNEVTSGTGHFLFSLFQILAVIVSINILIAMMTRSFEDIMDDAKKKWKISRARMLMSFIILGNRCKLPPPLNILRLIIGVDKLYKYIKGKCRCCRDATEEGATMQLDPKRESVLFFIVQRYIATYCKEKGLEIKDSNDDRRGQNNDVEQND